MKYYTICFPGKYGQNVVETWSTEQIIESYYGYWTGMMESVGKEDQISEEKAIEDWIVVNWAVETDRLGNEL